eukprot:scaffold30_cov255-Pinguiococcus_pyrenoidosus.AAC.4
MRILGQDSRVILNQVATPTTLPVPSCRPLLRVLYSSAALTPLPPNHEDPCSVLQPAQLGSKLPSERPAGAPAGTQRLATLRAHPRPWRPGPLGSGAFWRKAACGRRGHRRLQRPRPEAAVRQGGAAARSQDRRERFARDTRETRGLRGRAGCSLQRELRRRDHPLGPLRVSAAVHRLADRARLRPGRHRGAQRRGHAGGGAGVRLQPLWRLQQPGGRAAEAAATQAGSPQRHRSGSLASRSRHCAPCAGPGEPLASAACHPHQGSFDPQCRRRRGIDDHTDVPHHGLRAHRGGGWRRTQGNEPH